MRKKVLSLLLIISMLLSFEGITFASAVDVKGYTSLNPMGLNSEMKITNLKTANGMWKNASIKVSEVQIDNVGYKKINSTQDVRFSDTALRKLDAVKVKVTYTFSGFTGDKDSLMKDNLLAERIDAINSKGNFKDGGQIYYGFANGLTNKVEKYSLGGKTYKGEWYGKKIKDVNLSKPVTMTGYVYLILDKGKTEGAFVNFTFSSKNEVDQSEAYFVFSNKSLESRIKNTGTYIYGDEKVGYVKPTFEMTAYSYRGNDKDDDSIVLNYYRVGTEKDPILVLGLLKSSDTFGEDGIEEGIENYVDALVEDYGLEKNLENGNYVIKGISEEDEKYINAHVINKGSYFNVVIIKADVKEKGVADQLWETYKANNDLSPAKSSATMASYVYGSKDYGTFSVAEKLNDGPEYENALAYVGKQKDWTVTLKSVANSQEFANVFDSDFRGAFPSSKIVNLDNGNVRVYRGEANLTSCYIVLTAIKNNKFYIIGIDATLDKMTQVKKPVLKSYLLSLGYTESEVNTILSDGIFN